MLPPLSFLIFLFGEDLRFRAAHEVALQHRLVGKERFIVKILGSLRTVSDAGMALDANAGHFGRIRRIDAAHRAQRRAHAAAGTLVKVGSGLRLEELDALTVQSLRDVVRRIRIALDLDRRGDLGHLADLSDNGGAEFGKNGEILAVRATGGKRIGKGVLTGKRTAGDRVEAVRFQAGAKLGKGVIKAAVAKGYDRHGKRAVAGKARLDKIKELVGNLACIGRCAEYNEVFIGKGIALLSCIGTGEVHKLQWNLKALCKGVGKRGDDLAGIAGGAEINCVDGFDLHSQPSFYFGAHDPVLQRKLLCTVFTLVQHRGAGRNALERIVTEAAAMLGCIDDASAGADYLRIVDDAAALTVGAALFDVLAEKVKHTLPSCYKLWSTSLSPSIMARSCVTGFS